MYSRVATEVCPVRDCTSFYAIFLVCYWALGDRQKKMCCRFFNTGIPPLFCGLKCRRLEFASIPSSHVVEHSTTASFKVELSRLTSAAYTHHKMPPPIHTILHEEDCELFIRIRPPYISCTAYLILIKSNISYKPLPNLNLHHCKHRYGTAIT